MRYGCPSPLLQCHLVRHRKAPPPVRAAKSTVRPMLFERKSRDYEKKMNRLRRCVNRAALCPTAARSDGKGEQRAFLASMWVKAKAGIGESAQYRSLCRAREADRNRMDATGGADRRRVETERGEIRKSGPEVFGVQAICGTGKNTALLCFTAFPEKVEPFRGISPNQGRRMDEIRLLPIFKGIAKGMCFPNMIGGVTGIARAVPG